MWSGVWTFGDLPEDEQAALNAKNPSVRSFAYAWEESRKAANVLVPSANINYESKNEDEKNESINEVAADSVEEKDIAKDTTNETTKEKQETTAESSKASNDSNDVEMKSTKARDGGVKNPSQEVTTKCDDTKPTEMDEASHSKQRGKSAEERPAEEAKAHPVKDKSVEEANVANVDSARSKDDSSRPTVAFAQNDDQRAAKKAVVTFATTLPDDPPFTDADKKYPYKCPPGGAWKGYFETATVSPAFL